MTEQVDAVRALNLALGQLVQCLTPTPSAWHRRQSLVQDHIQRLQSTLRVPHPIRVSTFGSSQSGLCLADSDIDLGLFGSMHGVNLEAIEPRQAKDLLFMVLRSLHRARLADGNVQTVLGARVPVLKYKCALSGLDCDISIQGSGALLKANCINIINRHCPALSPLYRLVKLWAAAHDINDASRSTLNSTSLLYLSMFYLQHRQLLPPLRDLVPPEQLNHPTGRPLHPANRPLWDNPTYLTQLLAGVDAAARDWARQKQQQLGGSWVLPGLGDLLLGFFDFYAEVMTDWVLEKQREVYADLWLGCWSHEHAPDEAFAKDYIFLLQDPFDPTDCPARAVGTSTKTNNGVGVLITYLVSSSRDVIHQYLGQQCSSSSSSSSLRHELCQVLGWLFGPQAVLLMGSCPSLSHSPTPFAAAASAAGGGGRQGLLAARAAAAGAAALAGGAEATAGAAGAVDDWAPAPFDSLLVQRLMQYQGKQEQQRQNHQQQQQRSGYSKGVNTSSALTWLVDQLFHQSASGMPSSCSLRILCVGHLSRLNQAIKSGHLPGRLGEALTAKAADCSTAKQQQQQQRHEQEEWRLAWQQRLLLGPPLAAEDAEVLRIRSRLLSILGQQRRQPHPDRKRPPPVDHPRQVKEAFREAIARVAERLQQLGQQQPQQQQRQTAATQHLGPTANEDMGLDQQVWAAAAQFQQQQQQHDGEVAEEAGHEEASEGVGGYGLMAVLEQHGFIPILELWTMLKNGTLWPKVLPLPELLLQKQQQQPQQPQQQQDEELEVCEQLEEQVLQQQQHRQQQYEVNCEVFEQLGEQSDALATTAVVEAATEIGAAAAAAFAAAGVQPLHQRQHGRQSKQQESESRTAQHHEHQEQIQQQQDEEVDVDEVFEQLEEQGDIFATAAAIEAAAIAEISASAAAAMQSLRQQQHRRQSKQQESESRTEQHHQHHQERMQQRHAGDVQADSYKFSSQVTVRVSAGDTVATGGDALVESMSRLDVSHTGTHATRQQQHQQLHHHQQQHSSQHLLLMSPHGKEDHHHHQQHDQQQPHQQQQQHRHEQQRSQAAVREVLPHTPTRQRQRHMAAASGAPVQTMSTHADGLAESYIRKLEQNMSSPMSPQGQQQLQLGSSLPTHGSGDWFFGSPSKQTRRSLDYQQHRHNAAAEAAGGAAPPPPPGAATGSKKSLSAKLKSVRRGIKECEKKIEQKQQELQQLKVQQQQTTASAGAAGEQALSQDGRQKLFFVKEQIRRCESSIRQLSINLQKKKAAADEMAAMLQQQKSQRQSQGQDQ